jgi:hypothetical protein
MNRSRKRKLVAAGVAAVAVAGTGAAIGATQLGSPKAESQAIVNDAAKQLGVSPSALTNALKTALKNRVDAAVEAGRITKAEGDRIKARIDAGDFPIFGGPHGGFGVHVEFGGHLDAAASYLGLTRAELRTQLSQGKTLAQIAKDRDKSVDGLIDALVAGEKKELDAAVSAGRLTRAQADELLAGAKQRFTDLVNGKMPTFRHGFGFRRGFGPGFGPGRFGSGPPPDAPPML